MIDRTRHNEVIGGNAGLLLGFGVGLVAGIMLLVMLPGMPWAWRLEGTPTELDLIAQQSMAAAAWWMVAVSAASSVAGLIALYFVLKTWNEARRSADAAENAVHQAVEANRQARLMAQQQNRAYVVMSAMNFSADFDEFTLEWRLENSGHSPAKSVKMVASFDYYLRENGNWVLKDRETFSRFLADLTIGQPVSDEEIIFTSTLEDATVPAKGERIEVHGDVHYRDIYGQMHTDKFAFRSTNREDDWQGKQSMQRRPEPTKRTRQ